MRLLLACLLPLTAHALDLALPTDNQALLRGDNTAFYQPTVEGTVQSGMFGCVRSGGRRLHEGIDIRCLRRDKRGESLDEVRAIADGTVAFLNSKPGLSNYGRYIVLAHRWDGVEVFTLYAHLADITSGIQPGRAVAKNQPVGILGRSTNTREGIPPERAHLHLEVGFLMNTYFHIWNAKREPKAPPFGNFNGRNLTGLDPAALLLKASDPKFNFANHVASQPIAFTVLVPAKPFPWLQLHPEQIQPAPAGPVVAYEIGATAGGTPIAIWPRAEAKHRFPSVVRVDENVIARTGCRGLVQRGKSGWTLSESGRDWLSLLTYTP